MVGSAKRAYGAVLAGQMLTDEVLLSATAQVESFPPVNIPLRRLATYDLGSQIPRRGNSVDSQVGKSVSETRDLEK